MGIFKEMYERRQFSTDWEYRELRRMLSEAIAGGHVEKIPVMKSDTFLRTEEWFRDTQTGEVYSLVPPEEKLRGAWERVDLRSLIEPPKKVQ